MNQVIRQNIQRKVPKVLSDNHEMKTGEKDLRGKKGKKA